MRADAGDAVDVCERSSRTSCTVTALARAVRLAAVQNVDMDMRDEMKDLQDVLNHFFAVRKVSTSELVIKYQRERVTFRAI